VISAFLFPGQGSQEVGMGELLAQDSSIAARTFEEADEILGFPLSALAWFGPEEELRLTHNAQPALLVHSVAVYRSLEGALGTPRFVAGHSLGEFTAHVVAGTLSFEDAVRAVRLRGELMLDAGMRRPGTMAAVLGLEAGTIEELCATHGSGDEVCVPANYNSATQIVISGTPAGVERVAQAARAAGALKVVPLNVSGAFHSPLMADAAHGLSAFLETLQFSDPEIPVVANVTAAPITQGSRAREILVDQLTSPVRWSQSVEALVAGGVTHCLEIGWGRVLTGLVRRVDKTLQTLAVQGPEDVASLQEQS
jgi:[acyl-carrier-protein] S-malonyltransferase